MVIIDWTGQVFASIKGRSYKINNGKRKFAVQNLKVNVLSCQDSVRKSIWMYIIYYLLLHLVFCSNLLLFGIGASIFYHDSRSLMNSNMKAYPQSAKGYNATIKLCVRPWKRIMTPLVFKMHQYLAFYGNFV